MRLRTPRRATRSQVHFTVSSSTTNFNYAAYQVNTNEYFLISTDAISVNAPLASGRAIFTGSAFTNASLAGSYVIHQTGSAAGATAEVGLGLHVHDGILSGSIAGTCSISARQSPGHPEPRRELYDRRRFRREALTAASGSGTERQAIPEFLLCSSQCEHRANIRFRCRNRYRRYLRIAGDNPGLRLHHRWFGWELFLQHRKPR